MRFLPRTEMGIRKLYFVSPRRIRLNILSRGTTSHPLLLGMGVYCRPARMRRRNWRRHWQALGLCMCAAQPRPRTANRMGSNLSTLRLWEANIPRHRSPGLLGRCKPLPHTQALDTRTHGFAFPSRRTRNTPTIRTSRRLQVCRLAAV